VRDVIGYVQQGHLTPLFLSHEVVAQCSNFLRLDTHSRLRPCGLQSKLIENDIAELLRKPVWASPEKSCPQMSSALVDHGSPLVSRMWKSVVSSCMAKLSIQVAGVEQHDGSCCWLAQRWRVELLE